MLKIGWFINEINECGKQVRLCMEDGRLIYGTAKGIIKSNIPGGTLVFLSEGEEMHFAETEIADYVVV